MINQENFEQRPQRKPDESIGGRLLRWKDSDYTVFAPRMKRDEPAQTVVKESKGFKFYKNEGKKESSYSVHATIDAQTPDPANALVEKVLTGLGSELKEEPKIRAAKFLENQEGYMVWTAERNKKLKVLLTLDLGEESDLLSRRVLERATDLLGIIGRRMWKK